MVIFQYEAATIVHPMFFPIIGQIRKGVCVKCNILDTNLVTSVKTDVAQIKFMMK